MKRIVIAAWAALFAAHAHAQVLGLGTGPQGSISYNIGSAIARVMSEAGVQSRVQPYSRSNSALPLVNLGELDLAVCNVLEAHEAANGEGPYGGRKQPNVRMLAVIFPVYSSLFVRKDSPIRTIADLRGKRIPYGYSTQTTLQRVVDSVLANGGLTGGDVVHVLVPSLFRGAEDFAAGKTDAGYFSLGSAKVSELDKSVGGVRYLPLSDDPGAVAAMQKIFRYAYVAEVKPSVVFAGVREPTRLMAYHYVVLAGAHVDDAVVYRIAKTMHDDKARLVESLRSFAGFDPSAMYREDMPAPFHPGAVKYYKENRIGAAK